MTSITQLKQLHQDLLPQLLQKKKDMSNANIKAELIFCLCTPQTNAKKAWEATEKILKNNYSKASHIAPILRESGVRFCNRKALYIEIAISNFPINTNLLNQYSGVELRNKLAHKIKGYGLKEASHFLRNIGMGEKLCILDRHILRSLKEWIVMDEIPTSLTKCQYLELEQRMLTFAELIKISPFDLDFVFWYQSHGELFK